MCHSFNIWEQEYETNCIYNEIGVAVNSESDCYSRNVGTELPLYAT
jgi:hypothetical protein